MNDRVNNRQDRRDNLQDRMDNRWDNREDFRDDRWENRDDIREDWQDWYGDNWNHDDWHHGCWDGHYGDYWDHMWDEHPVAAAFGLTAWGVNRLSYWSGYYPYYNPYYTESYPVSDSVTVDYSQPLVIYEQAADELAVSGQAPPVELPPAAPATPGQPPAPAPQDPALTAFDQARQAFYDGNYQAALDSVNTALASMTDDAVLHEFRALVLFAMGKYKDAAAGLHAVLAVGPGWDWTTMSALYASVDTYTQQLRALEAAQKQSPEAPELRLVLAYHYVTAGHLDAAAAQFKKLVELQPRDQVARQLLEMTAGPDAVPGVSPGTPPAPGDTEQSGVSVAAADLIGTWNATGADSGRFGLTFNDKGEFTWVYTAGGKETKLSGVYAVDGTDLALEPDEGGVMLATITPPENGMMHFKVVGSPPDDKGLDFKK
jgi:tetratricopeptide (TPR) repeat protein